MTFREKLAFRIRLLLAVWLGPEAWRKELESIRVDLHLHRDTPAGGAA